MWFVVDNAQKPVYFACPNQAVTSLACHSAWKYGRLRAALQPSQSPVPKAPLKHYPSPS